MKSEFERIKTALIGNRITDSCGRPMLTMLRQQ